MSKLSKPKSTAKKAPSKKRLITSDVSKVPQDYKAFLEDLKNRIRSTQLRAAVKVNEELIRLYWEIRVKLQKNRKQVDGALIL
jgi:hypothetical protein